MTRNTRPDRARKPPAMFDPTIPSGEEMKRRRAAAGLGAKQGSKSSRSAKREDSTAKKKKTKLSLKEIRARGKRTLRKRGLQKPASIVYSNPAAVPRPFPDPKDCPAWCRNEMKQFLKDGYCNLEHGLSLDQVIDCRQAVFMEFSRMMDTVKRLDLGEVLTKRGFRNFKTRSRGRFDLELDSLTHSKFDFLRSPDAPWVPLVKALLGDDCRLAHTGVMLSMPNSTYQPWHSDGEHVGKRKHLPPHCLNVFIPLTNITVRNGGTEMIPGTHMLGEFDKDEDGIILLAKAGEIILFDFRLKHRGLSNHDVHPRPLLYLQYCIPAFEDTANFSKWRYKQLPTIDKQDGRERRRAKRRSRMAEDESDDDDDDNDDMSSLADSGLASSSTDTADDKNDEPAKPDDKQPLRRSRRASAKRAVQALVAPKTKKVKRATAAKTDEAQEERQIDLSWMDTWDGPKDWIEDFPTYQAQQDHEEDHEPESKTLAELRHDARTKHRDKVKDAPRVCGIACYRGAPVLACDVNDSEKWYAAQLVKVDMDDKTALVHFMGWAKRHDIWMELDPEYLRPAPADVLVAHVNGVPGPIDPKNPLKSLKSFWEQ